MTSEEERIASADPAWEYWGSYLSERAWGTVREDYSPNGDAWNYFTHDQARSRAYRWNEDGLAGISDHEQRICFALALWNGNDPILKERLFGLTGKEGNHGEDVKEVFFYLDNTPTHSYMRVLYKYPHAVYPYSRLLAENARRTRADDEYELEDTGIFDQNRYFDVFVEYAKASPYDILIKIDAINRGPEPAQLTILPSLWFRNIWSWNGNPDKPTMRSIPVAQYAPARIIQATHTILGPSQREAPGTYILACEHADTLLFTENDTNSQRLFGIPNTTPYVKDAFDRYVVHQEHAAVNPDETGTKAAALYTRTVQPGESFSIRLRLTLVAGYTGEQPPEDDELRAKAAASFADFDNIMQQRKQENDEYFAGLLPEGTESEWRAIHHQAIAGMLWSKQFYHYVVEQWLKGDPAEPPPPSKRLKGRNADWRHLYNERVMSMPDTWEYPWYATWDLAFHCVVLAMVDSEFAKSQMLSLVREWYQHPNGQLPAYEWNFNDVNPPVFAWAAYRIYEIERDINNQRTGKQEVGDLTFLERIFHKLLINFTWWVNRKDSEGNNIFQGGFLGLDNIGVFDRSAPLPGGGYLEQSDSTSWMAMFSLNMMKIALELARANHSYENIANKFFEHFLSIANAMNNLGSSGISLWCDDDEFFYDVLHMPDNRDIRIKVHSLVGLIPLLAIEIVEPQLLSILPDFKYRLEWILKNRPDLANLVSHWHIPGAGDRRLLALTRGHRMKRLLKRMLDPNEFLSDYGVRSLSKYHAAHPYVLHLDSTTYQIDYEPAESRSGIFGGNSNWRGPVWFPINFLLIEALRKYHRYYSDDFLLECPTGSGDFLTLNEIADDLSRRLISLFVRNDETGRPCNGNHRLLQSDPYWRDYILFHEYFHGDTGKGLGASHQTGWTGLVALLIEQQTGQIPRVERDPSLEDTSKLEDEQAAEDKHLLAEEYRLNEIP